MLHKPDSADWLRRNLTDRSGPETVLATHPLYSYLDQGNIAAVPTHDRSICQGSQRAICSLSDHGFVTKRPSICRWLRCPRPLRSPRTKTGNELGRLSRDPANGIGRRIPPEEWRRFQPDTPMPVAAHEPADLFLSRPCLRRAAAASLSKQGPTGCGRQTRIDEVPTFDRAFSISPRPVFGRLSPRAGADRLG